MKISLMAGILFLAAGLMASSAAAHCQIPCGIYDDGMRFEMMYEHIVTIDKSMTQINELSAAGEKNYNQIVRWVTNKEDHGGQFSEIVTAYFLAQRVKPVDPSDAAGHARYVKMLELLHHMQVYAMKCKQTVDREHPAKLKSLVDDFKAVYMDIGEKK